jgi:formate-dependent nitrite reductase membrane component NrfD
VIRDSGDGRNIDPQLGSLSGEGSLQRGAVQEAHRIETRGTEYPTGTLTYYDTPVIKRAVWSWTVPLYYYVGGTAGGSAVLGAAAILIAPAEFPRLIVGTRWISALGGVISGGLLIHDLGRPSRFLNMLRVFRPTSPMNLGSWVLTGFGAASTVSLVAMEGPPFLHRIGKIAGIKAGVLGLILSGYTGVLVANTVVPVWQRPRRMLPLLFLASAMSSASSLLDFFDWNLRERKAIALFGAIGYLADLTCGQIVEQQIALVPEAVKPLHEGFSGFLWRAGKAMTAISLALSLAPGHSNRKRRCIGVLGTTGALCLRFGIHYAGQRSADNPRAIFLQQHADKPT